MLKLYKIRFRHYSPKDSESGIKGYMVAEHEATVADYVARTHMLLDDFELDERLNKYGDTLEDYVDELPEDEEEFFETRRDRLARYKGDLEDDGVHLSDLHYGATLYGWEEVGPVTPGDLETLNSLGMLIQCHDQV